MLPSTEVKTHVVTFKDTDEAIYITSDVAVKLSKFRNHPSSVSFPLVNSTTGVLIRDIGKYEIRSIHEIKKEAQRTGVSTGMKWVCDYGVRHFMGKDCACSLDYRMPGIRLSTEFMEWCRNRFPKSFPRYPSDITQTMRDKFLEEKSLITSQ